MSGNSVSIREASIGYGDQLAVEGLTLDVPGGSVFGLLGPNGAGKSTTIQMLMGLLRPCRGSLEVLGINPARDSLAVRQRVGYVAEKHGFYERLTVQDHVDLVAPYHSAWNHGLCTRLMREFILDGDARIGTLSKGSRAKLALLLALSFEPDMLVLDEPAGGLDPAARRNFIESILHHYQDEGRTVVLSSHLLNEFAGILDHVAFLRDGCLEFVSSLDDLHASTKRVRLIFENGVPPDVAIPEAMTVKVTGREVVAVFDSFNRDTVGNLARLGADRRVVEDLSLEDVFVERANR